MPNCCPYSVGRYNELGGDSGWKIVGDAGEFFGNAKKNGIPTGQLAKLGAIACFPNHVMNVEEIIGSKAKCSQSHYNGVLFDFYELDLNSPEYKGQKLQGYIYLPFDFEEDTKMYRVQTGAYSVVKNVVNMFDKLVADGYSPIVKLYDDLYHVQVGAYSVKSNATKMSKELQGKGYDTIITDKTGVDVSIDELRKEPFKPYMVRIDVPVLNVRSGAGTEYPVRRTVVKGDAYTIIEEQNGWGRLKSGAGWICLEYTSKV